MFPFKNHGIDEQPLFNDTAVILFEIENAEENDQPAETDNNVAEPLSNLDNNEIQEVRRSSRNVVPPIWHKDYVMKSSNVKYPISDYISYTDLSNTHQNYMCAISKNREPNSYHEACLDENWINAMSEKIHVVELNKTRTLVQ